MCDNHTCDNVGGRLSTRYQRQTSHIQDTVCALQIQTQVSHLIGMLAKEHQGMFNFSQYLAYVVFDFLLIVLKGA